MTEDPREFGLTPGEIRAVLAEERRITRRVRFSCSCRDCGAETYSSVPGVPAEWYHVHDHVWAAAGMRPADGYLCIGCLERRLGRRLSPGDFTHEDGNINSLDPRLRRFAWAHRTRRLTDRLTGQLALWEDAADDR